MKRFLTALAVAALLITGAVVYANDFTFTGASTNKWELAANWAGAGPTFPGSGGRTWDRVLYNADAATPGKLLFDVNSGDAAFGPLQSRKIAEIMIDANAAAKHLEVEVQVDVLYLGQVKVVTTSTTNGDVEIELLTGKLFIESLDMSFEGTTGTTKLDADTNLEISQRTVLDGKMECEPDAEVVIDLGYFVMKDGSVFIKLDDGVCESS